MKPFKHKYLLKRDKPDARDTVVLPVAKGLPLSVNLRSHFPPVYNQGTLGSCSANAIAAALDFVHNLNQPGKGFFTPSRLFIYYNERDMEGTTSEDGGASLRDGIKSINRAGACRESIWAYDVSKFSVKPPRAAYKEALGFRGITYGRVPLSPIAIMTLLASGLPIVCGIAVYESFESAKVAKTGAVHLPDISSEQFLGGHAVVIVGYTNSGKTLVMRNSWGEAWGKKGYFTLPMSYITDPNLTWDAWAIRKAL